MSATSTPVDLGSDPLSAASDPIVDVSHVSLRFGGVRSLSDVSLSQERGQILSVIGPNGAGKTSLFNCLSGVYTPQEGRITFHADHESNASIIGMRPHRVNHLGIARTFQTSRLFNALSTFDNVKIGIEARQRTGPLGAMLHLPRTRREERDSDRRAIELLEFVGLRAEADVQASALAYGDQRRLEIARALGTEPKLLLLDEPAAGTNPSEKLELAQLIRRVNAELGVSVLLIEHDMALVMSVADRIVVLNFGEVIAAGTTAEVQRNPAVIEAYLGAPDPEDTKAADDPLAASGLTAPLDKGRDEGREPDTT